MKYHITRNAIYLLLILSAIAHANPNPKKLIFAADLVRHGARTPIWYLKANNIKYPVAWRTMGNGELTGKGMSQAQRLGQSLRRYYVDTQHFLPGHYDGKRICVRSTAFNRTFTTALSILLGFYPPTKDNSQLPLQIHWLPQSEDTLLSHVDTKTARYLFLKYLKTPELKRKTHQAKKYFPAWQKKTGYTMQDTNALMRLVDTLKALQNYCGPSTNNACVRQFVPLSDNDIARAIALDGWLFSYKSAPPEIGKSRACGFVSEIAANMSKIKVTKHKHWRSYILYTAHDVTLFSVMSYLQQPLKHPPSFVADLRFRLLRGKNNRRFVYIDYYDNQTEPPLPVYRGSLKAFTAKFFDKTCLNKTRRKQRCLYS